VERAARYGAPGAVLLIDLDNFKEVNDTFGHMAGDDLLKGIGGLLRHRMRHTDTLARVGGDEFAVLLPQIGAEQAQIVADEFVKSLSRQTAVLASQSIGITASVGVALFDGLGGIDSSFAGRLPLERIRSHFASRRPTESARRSRGSSLLFSGSRSLTLRR